MSISKEYLIDRMKKAQNEIDYWRKDDTELGARYRSYYEGKLYELKNLSRKIEKEKEENKVEVVRCKDCKFRGNFFCCPMKNISLYLSDNETQYVDYTTDNSFCDVGRRKNE